MIRLEDIITAYYTARSNKRRTPDQVEFELHWQSGCYNLYNEIIERNVQPTAYTFIVRKPKPREVFASDFKTRIIHHYIDIRLRPLLEARMSTHNFNNRVGMGTSACQNAVISDIYEMSKGFMEDAYIIKLDLKGCFPNINQEIAYKQLTNVILHDYNGDDKDELLYMIRICVFSYPAKHCRIQGSKKDWDSIPKGKSLFSKPDGIGAAIGHLIWQNAVNYYFNSIDQWLLSHKELRYERFVDDMYIVSRSKLVLHIIPELRRRLSNLGAKLNDHKFYCQHYTKGCECLGLHIKMDRIYVNSRVVNNAKRKAIAFNRCIGEAKIERLVSSMNSYLGIFKNTNGFARSYEVYNLLSSA